MIQYAPALLGVLSAASKNHGLDRKAASALTGMFRCRYQPYQISGRNKIQRTVSSTIDLIKNKTNWESESVERLLNNVGSAAQKVSDTLMNIQNPFRDLELNEDSALNLNIILKHCHLHRPLPFWYAVPFWKQAYAEKIAEGAYGEIYNTQDVHGSARVIKFVPVHGCHPDVNHMNLSFEEVLPDLMCSKFLGKLRKGLNNAAPNFPHMYGLYLVWGPFPKTLTKAWWKWNYDTRHDDSQAPRPDRYSKDQLFVMQELEHCGVDLDRNISLFTNDAIACVVCISQVVAALAVAEAAYQFEHRDLHVGNVMVKPTSVTEFDYLISGIHYTVSTYGYHFYIIDFTLSRMQVGNETFFSQTAPADPMNFQDINWSNHHHVYGAQTTVINDTWREFHPFTNVLWIKYIIENFYDMLQNNDALDEILESTVQRDAYRCLRGWRENILFCNSARHFFISELASVQLFPYVSPVP